MNTVKETTWIPICCVCHQIRDDRQSHEHPTRNGVEKWLSLRSFLRLYPIPQGAYQLTHTYCERCMEQQGFDRPQLGNDLGHAQAGTLQEEIRRRIVSAIASTSECDLDTIVSNPELRTLSPSPLYPATP